MVLLFSHRLPLPKNDLKICFPSSFFIFHTIQKMRDELSTRSNMECFSFDSLFVDKEFASTFEHFLEENGGSEVFRFILDVRQYKSLRKCSDSLSQEQAQRLFNRIMNKYIWWRSSSELKVNSSLKDKIINLYMKNGFFAPITIFDETLFTCCSYLRIEKWKAFIRSKIFAEFKARNREQKVNRREIYRWTLPFRSCDNYLIRSTDFKYHNLWHFIDWNNDKAKLNDSIMRRRSFL